MKIVHGRTSVANKIDVLQRLRDVQCPHLPEIVWAPSGEHEFGIVPLGVPVDFREPQTTSRVIVQCLIDGLESFPGLGIVHRDIRPSNLILDYTKASVNVVIRVGGPQDKPTSETLELMRLWDDIEKSCIWEPFVKAAKARDYELLKGMADVFCHV